MFCTYSFCAKAASREQKLLFEGRIFTGLTYVVNIASTVEKAVFFLKLQLLRDVTQKLKVCFQLLHSLLHFYYSSANYFELNNLVPKIMAWLAFYLFVSSNNATKHPDDISDMSIGNLVLL